MSIPINNRKFFQNFEIRFFPKEEEAKELKSCIQHCNLQIKNEQRSWAKTVYDNKITIITLVASSVITRIALNSLFSMSMVALPLIAVPMFYATYKLYSLQDEANNRLVKTQKVFLSVFSKYAENTPSSQESVNTFINNFTNSPRKFSSLEAKERLDEIIETYGNSDNMGTLVKMVFSQVVKDRRHLDKINDYQSTFQMGSTAILLIAQNIDQFLGPYSFLSSKLFLVNSVLFTTGVIGGYAAYNYIKHRNDHEIRKDIFDGNLKRFNAALNIPIEHRAYS